MDRINISDLTSERYLTWCKKYKKELLNEDGFKRKLFHKLHTSGNGYKLIVFIIIKGVQVPLLEIIGGDVNVLEVFDYLENHSLIELFKNYNREK